MPSLKDLRNRRESVRATRKITKAMQMVAAAKLRRAQETASAARPYAGRMARVLGGFAAEANGGAFPLLVGTGKDQSHLLIVMTAERGLCGAFNANIVRLARSDASRLENDGKTVSLLCVGRKGYELLRREWGRRIIERVDLKGVKQLAFANAQDIANKVLALFREGKFDRATLYFSEFKSVISQMPTALQLIPVKPAEDGPRAAVNDYEPELDEILSYLAPRNVAAQIFRGLLENAASEQGARMSAMDSATRNAGEMIDKLNLRYNRLRQANITKELIEIISGAEAL